MVLDVAGYHGSAVRRVAVMLKGRVKLYCFVSSVSVYGDSSEERDAAFAAAGKTLKPSCRPGSIAILRYLPPLRWYAVRPCTERVCRLIITDAPPTGRSARADAG